MIEPPSVSESSTACRAMVERTLSTSRLELTASPTSCSASRASTFFASSALRASSCCTSMTPLTAIAAWAAKADTMAMSRSSNGLHFVAPYAERADDLVVEEHRGAHDGPESRHPLEVVSPVVRVGEHVGDLLGPPVQRRPGRSGSPGPSGIGCSAMHPIDSSETPTDLISR